MKISVLLTILLSIFVELKISILQYAIQIRI